MKMNTSLMTFKMIIILTITMTLSSNNFLFSWMNLEMNMIMFIPLMTKDKKMNEQIMKYLIIQSSSSMLMLMSMMLNSTIESPINMSILLTMSMLMKLGMMPTHLWMPNLMNNLSWKNCFLMTTMQKIIPTLITTQTIQMKMMMIPMIMSLIMAPISGMKQMSLKKMMAYSSISNLTWMLISMYISKLHFIMFMMIYMMNNLMIMKTMSNMKLNYMNQLKTLKKEQKIMITMTMISMSGMPPMLGFFPKWIILQSMVSKSMIISMSMIISSIISTYMYMKILNFVILSMSVKKFMKPSKTSTISILMNLTMGIPILMILKF